MSGCDGFSDNDGEVPEMLSAIPVEPADQSEGTPCFLCTGTKPITKMYYGKPLDVCCWNGIRAKLHQLKRKGPEAVQADVAQMLSDTGAWRKGTLPFTGGPSERSLARVEMHKIVSTTETVDVQQKVRIDDDLGLTKPRYISYIRQWDGKAAAAKAGKAWDKLFAETTPRSRADDSADLRLSADDLGSWGRFADRRASLGFSADDHSSWGTKRRQRDSRGRS